MQCWQQGQEALRDGKADEAIALYRRSLQIDPKLSRNYLSLAAAYSGKGDDGRAVEYLARYLQFQPDHVSVRAHLAEILLRLERPEAARLQFERCIVDLQDGGEIEAEKLIHCEARLVKVAEILQDEYAEDLHRGIGLYLLACQRATVPDAEEEPSAQGLLFKAARELSAAGAERPEEARPCWYLHKVWSRLAQQQPAERWLRAAADAAAFSDLTPAERRELQTTYHSAAVLHARK
jgi:tetratricopeptide (TPR) repeat protein